MKKLLSLAITYFLIQGAAFAQEPAFGKVRLVHEKEVAGVIDINSFINSAIVTLEDGRQQTYHASMIEEIVTVDECDRERIYRCFDYRSNGFFDRLEKKLFQVVNDGNITLLRRVFEYDVFDAADEYEIEEYYFYHGEKVHRIKNFRRQVMPLMSDHSRSMEVFRERNKIKHLNKEGNMYLMVSYYNRISQSDALLHKN